MINTIIQFLKTAPLQIKILLFGGILLLIVYFIGLIFVFIFPSQQPQETVVTPRRPEATTPQEIVEERSASIINDIKDDLPYERRYTLSTGLPVTTVIQETEDPSMLSINIIGIDFNIDEDDPDYFLMYRSFNEAALDAIAWIEENGGSGTYLLIQWSENINEHQTAEAWLRGH